MAFVNNWYEGFSGALHRDADLYFELLFESNRVNPSYCHSRAHWKFEPIAKAARRVWRIKRCVISIGYLQ